MSPEPGGEESRYVPALGYRWLTALYDPVVALTTRERTFKERLVAQARLAPGMDMLDLGCGTGTLAIRALRQEPGLRIVGLDGDPQVLERARRKAERAGAGIELRRGLAQSLPFADASFDRVLSSLFLHHLSPRDKLATLREARRVLRPGGELHIADWGRPSGLWMRLAFYSIQALDGFENTRDHAAGRIPAFIADAGFQAVLEAGTLATVYGTISFWSAVKA